MQSEQGGPLGRRFFSFLLRTALKDHPKGPSTANHQPPTTNRRQPPTVANRQQRPTANRQPLLTAINHQSPTTNCRQPPSTAANRHQLPVASRQLPTANRQHMVCPWAFLGNLGRGTLLFFFFVKDRPESEAGPWKRCASVKWAEAIGEG